MFWILVSELNRIWLIHFKFFEISLNDFLKLLRGGIQTIWIQTDVFKSKMCYTRIKNLTVVVILLLLHIKLLVIFKLQPSLAFINLYHCSFHTCLLLWRPWWLVVYTCWQSVSQCSVCRALLTLRGLKRTRTHARTHTTEPGLQHQHIHQTQN